MIQNAHNVYFNKHTHTGTREKWETIKTRDLIRRHDYTTSHARAVIMKKIGTNKNIVLPFYPRMYVVVAMYMSFKSFEHVSESKR